MLKDNWRFISRIHRVLDNLVITGAFVVSYQLRDQFLNLLGVFGVETAADFNVLAPFSDYFVIFFASITLFNLWLSILGAYESMRFAKVKQLLKMSVLASAMVFISIGFIAFVLKIDFSRSLLGLYCLVSCFALFVERMGALAFLRYVRALGKNFRRVLILGDKLDCDKVEARVVEHPELGVRVVSVVDESIKLEDFESSLKELVIDEVIFATPGPVAKKFAQITSEEGVRVTLVADVFSLELRNSRVSDLAGLPLIHFERSGCKGGSLISKRLFDLILGTVLFLGALPLFILISVVILVHSGRPVFFRQHRVGLNGRLFMLYKFRSMVNGAEEKLFELKEQNEMSGPVFKIESDPRVTSVGRFLRRFSLDELPQLINVIKGEMSLVGPRPPLPSEVSKYKRFQRRRLSIRPGLTCTWQVNGRNKIRDFEEWANLDLEYIDNWSMWKDLKLILKTFPAVLRGTGS